MDPWNVYMFVYMHVTMCRNTDVSEELAASIFRIILGSQSFCTILKMEAVGFSETTLIAI
jgi:hypothetical protein